MIQELTQIERDLGKMIKFYCLILAAICLLFLLGSCSNVRSIKNKDGIVKVAKKENKAQNSNRNMKVDTVNSSIEDFINKVEKSKDAPIYEITNEEHETETKAATAQTISNKKLLTLREQMQNLANDQEQIKTNVNTLQKDVSDIKVSIGEIKDAVAVMNFSPNKTPERGGEVVPSQVIESEDEFYNANSEIAEPTETNERIESDEVVNKKVEAKPIAKPKILKKNQTPPKVNKNKDGAHNNVPVVISPKVEKKPVLNNFKATSKIETPKPVQTPAKVNSKPVQAPDNTAVKTAQNPNNNVQQALDYFSKKDYQRAINELNTVLTKHSDPETLATCSYWLGESYFRLGNYQNAIKCFEKTVVTGNSSKKEEAKVMLGESNLRMGKVQEARQAFEQFIAAYPKSRYIPRAKKLLQQL